MFKKVSLGIVSLAVALVGVVAVMAPRDAGAVSYPYCVQNTYRYGNSGSCVGWIQHMMNGVKATSSYGTPWAYLTVDGIFGTKTKTAVMWEQDQRHLTVDGIVGYNTWRDICIASMNGHSWPYGSYQHTAWQAGLYANCPIIVSGYPTY